MWCTSTQRCVSRNRREAASASPAWARASRSARMSLSGVPGGGSGALRLVDTEAMPETAEVGIRKPDLGVADGTAPAVEAFCANAPCAARVCALTDAAYEPLRPAQ